MGSSSSLHIWTAGRGPTLRLWTLPGLESFFCTWVIFQRQSSAGATACSFFSRAGGWIGMRRAIFPWTASTWLCYTTTPILSSGRCHAAIRSITLRPGPWASGRLPSGAWPPGCRASRLRLQSTGRPGARHSPKGLRRHHRQLGGRQRAAPLHDASCGQPAVGGVVSAGRSFP